MKAKWYAKLAVRFSKGTRAEAKEAIQKVLEVIGEDCIESETQEFWEVLGSEKKD